MWEKELEVCKKAAVIAGWAIMDIYNSADFGVEYKKDESPLTAADKASNAVIIKALEENFPTYAILSEEEKDNKKRLENKLCFVVDPLDGTKEFIKRNGQFTVNIGLSVDHYVNMGVIYVPVTGELYYAAKGVGAYLVSLPEEYTKQGDVAALEKYLEQAEAKKLTVSDNTDTKSLKVVMSNSHGCEAMEELLKKYELTNFVKVGSSLKGCMVATGQADVYFRHNPTMEWDTCAMQCIVEEAGGIFKQMDDSDMCYNRENSLNDKGFYAINVAQNRLR